MNILPDTKAGRVRLSVFPFKAYIILMPAVAFVCDGIANLAGWLDLDTYSGAATVYRELANQLTILLWVYGGSLAALLLSLTLFHDRRSRRSVLALTALGLIVLAMFCPATIAMKMR